MRIFVISNDCIWPYIGIPALFRGSPSSFNRYTVFVTPI
jgi:hypothetical protein